MKAVLAYPGELEAHEVHMSLHIFDKQHPWRLRGPSSRDEVVRNVDVKGEEAALGVEPFRGVSLSR